jgi:hypothetical protein
MLRCDNGKHCPYGEEVETDSGERVSRPAPAYSQRGNFLGLCLNCYDDWLRHEPELD